MADRTHINLAPGERAMIELMELGSSGYLWNLEELDQSVVRVLSRQVRRQRAEDGEPRIGGASILALEIEGVAPGSAEAGMRRPWLPADEAAATLLVTCG